MDLEIAETDLSTPESDMLAFPVVLSALLPLMPSGAVHLKGRVLDALGTALPEVVVELVEPESILPRMSTGTGLDGTFALDSGETDAVAPRLDGAGRLVVELSRAAAVRLELLSVAGHLVAVRTLDLPAGRTVIDHPGSMLPASSTGVHVARVREGRSVLAQGLVARLGAGEEWTRWVSQTPARRSAATAGSRLELRREGFLRKILPLEGLSADLRDIVLERDPLEDRIDSVMAKMELADKLGQMTQGVLGTGDAALGTMRLGSLLSGGGEPLPDYDALQDIALGTPRGIPMIYGIDAVHGTAKLEGATIFPHHIGLGATRDSSLVRRIGEITATEMLASGTDWAFSPCIAVPQDDRWGRTYEGFGETPELAALLGAAEIRGLQGAGKTWSVLACAKHFLADGGTTWGTGTQNTALDQGDALIDMEAVRRTHLPGYVAAVREGVGSVMASYSSIAGKRNHANGELLTGVLKKELGFDGFVVSDWLAIGQIHPLDYEASVRDAVNAGVDMGMEPNQHKEFILALNRLVTNGDVSMARIDDAVRRILRTKFRLGRMDAPRLPVFFTDPVGSPAHRAVGREAVRRSLVVLVNDSVLGKPALPLPTEGVIAVHGSHSDDAGLQCGGWTMGWQGAAGAVTGATTILSGMRSVFGSERIATGATRITGAKAAVFVLGEQPYAEMRGDLEDRDFDDFPVDAATAALMASYRSAGVPVVTVFVSGRARPVPTLLGASDAFVAAWLPGSEGAGVADVLSGTFAPTGILPVSWPSPGQTLVNHGDGKVPFRPYGFGLTW